MMNTAHNYAFEKALGSKFYMDKFQEEHVKPLLKKFLLNEEIEDKEDFLKLEDKIWENYEMWLGNYFYESRSDLYD